AEDDAAEDDAAEDDAAEDDAAAEDEESAEDEATEEDDSSEDFAHVFQGSLPAEGRTETLDFGTVFGDANGNGGADEGTDAPGDTDDEDQAEPVERRGDSVPPSEKLEMSAGEAPSDASEEAESPPDDSPSFASRPDSSFLWVTEQPTDHSAAVSIDRLGESRARDANAFLLRGRGKKPYKLLTRIRSHADMSIYLKPVFWRRTEGIQSPVGDHVDGEWTRDEREVFGALQGQAASINQRVNNLIDTGGEEGGGVELRVLRFMATRNHEFTPRRTVENADGFVYPKLSPLLERESRSGGGELSQVLRSLEDRRLLAGEFVLRQRACRNCSSAFLNFEEMCPHCGSTDIDTDDLVHHFRCAFTGALDEYKEEQGKLVCPKCDRALKQIGVDYDKPSVVHTCNRCSEQFQDPEIQSTCYRCEHTNPPDRQVERQIKEYEVTALGEETAMYGLSDSLLSILERESRVLDYATFQLIVESEAARIERYERSTSSLLLVRVTGLKDLRMELGDRSQEVIEEIATAFDNTLRSSDYLSSRDESLYMFLLTETDQSGARRAGERLENNIEGVLSQNLQRPPQLDIAVQPVYADVDLDDLSEQFLGRHPEEPAVANGR
ncbi:MAG: hypothetical protein ABEL04_00555, partial [Salinibacter sp.]|uniref:TackOD1 domain-containing metal-binding protein n=1 Tax=Salinibacter sp. TaxID=2065818 RepID=UPI0035D41E13